jgi:hypothetical protein
MEVGPVEKYVNGHHAIMPLRRAKIISEKYII